MDTKNLLLKNNTSQYGNQPPPPAPEPVRYDHCDECVGCAIPAHGFVCHFSDGKCLRFPKGRPEPE